MEQFFETSLCVKCKGKGWCNKPCKIYSKIKDFTPKKSKHFSGNSPPEIFVGRYNYPDIQAGILSPEAHGDTSELSMPEIWHEKNLQIPQILTNRSQLIYGKFQTSIKKARTKNKFTNLMQEISMTHKPVSTEFFLKKIPKKLLEINKYSAAIGNPAPLKFARLQENPKVKSKVNYLTTDTDCKSVTAIKELHKSNIQTSHIIKILSAGLLGTKTRRRLVPTRWSITAVDDTISKEMIKKIKYYPEINEILLFHGDYVGNHYEFLLLPDKFSFEVIEAYMSGSVWNPLSPNIHFAQDFERFRGRKKYAYDVTGAYYTARIALAEYLERIKRQAYTIIFREERPEYNAPLGVGILRQLARKAFEQKPEVFDTITEALQRMQSRMKLPTQEFAQKSILLKEYGVQKRLKEFF
jgi:DNA repair protein NreA